MEISLVSMGFYGAGVVVSWLFGRGVFNKLPERILMAICFTILAGYCLLLPYCLTPAAIIAAQLLGGAGRNLLHTLLMAVAPAEIPADKKATAIGFFQCVYSLGMTAGPMVMGSLLDLFEGYLTAFCIMAAVALCAALFALLAVRRTEKAL